MPRPRRNEPEEQPALYHVKINDAELGTIRFGPLDAQELRGTPEEWAAEFKDRMDRDGLIETLRHFDLYPTMIVYLIGDDGTKIEIGTIEP